MVDDRKRPSHRDVTPVRELVTDDEAWEAMVLLDETEWRAAKAFADKDYYAYRLGAAEAFGGLQSEEKSADRRKFEARTTPQYLAELEAWRLANETSWHMRLQRDTAKLKLELWRTIHADKRARDIQDGTERR